jgi:hypothetical protein
MEPYEDRNHDWSNYDIRPRTAPMERRRGEALLPLTHGAIGSQFFVALQEQLSQHGPSVITRFNPQELRNLMPKDDPETRPWPTHLMAPSRCVPRAPKAEGDDDAANHDSAIEDEEVLESSNVSKKKQPAAAVVSGQQRSEQQQSYQQRPAQPPRPQGDGGGNRPPLQRWAGGGGGGGHYKQERGAADGGWDAPIALAPIVGSNLNEEDERSADWEMPTSAGPALTGAAGTNSFFGFSAPVKIGRYSADAVEAERQRRKALASQSTAPRASVHGDEYSFTDASARTAAQAAAAAAVPSSAPSLASAPGSQAPGNSKADLATLSFLENIDLGAGGMGRASAAPAPSWANAFGGGSSGLGFGVSRSPERAGGLLGDGSAAAAAAAREQAGKARAAASELQMREQQSCGNVKCESSTLHENVRPSPHACKRRRLKWLTAAQLGLTCRIQRALRRIITSPQRQPDKCRP